MHHATFVSTVRATSCKSQQEKITQQENTFLGIKFAFLLSYFFLLTYFFHVDFYKKGPLHAHITLNNHQKMTKNIFLKIYRSSLKFKTEI